MPSVKSRSKEDTWTTKELDSALNDDRERQRRERREKRERKDKSSTRDDKRNTKERVIRDDNVEKKRSKDSDDRRKDRSIKDDRQRDAEREERRRKREGEPEKKSSSRHRNEDDRNRREKDREDPLEKRSSRHRSDDVEKKRSDKSERHGSKDIRDDDRRRRDKPREPEDRKRSDRLKERDDDDDRRRRNKKEDDDEDRDKRRNERHRKKEENGDSEREKRRKEKREEDEREKRRRERREVKESSSSRSKVDSEKENDKQSEDEEEENGNDYNYDDDDFEDYDDDFEEDDDAEEEEKPQNIKSEDREMSDLLKALDEENARLAAGSVDTNHSDYSDQYHDNDESKKSQKPVSRGKTFINFVNAKQRAVDQKVSNKTRKRGQDLLNLIEFDHASFDIFELPPVKEYELYIRTFGRTDTKQAYIQTNEDNLDRDIQTEEIDLQDKWTQYPAEDLVGCGGDNVESQKQELNPVSDLDSTRMVSFLSKAAQAIGILLNEESSTSNEDGEKGIKSNLSASDGYHQLGTPVILKDRHVTYANYSPSQPNYLLTCYSMPSLDSEYTSIRKGIICVWNIMEPSNPQKYLACESQPNCCCFSPNRTSLVCAGMTDGSLVIWDLREQGFMHRIIKLDHEEYLFRFPTYNTAGVSESENHHSPVQSMVPVFPDPTSLQYKEETDNSGLSFQLASLEKNGSVNLWVVTEITSPDSAGSEVDLGLSPGGKIKLVKSSTIKLTSPMKLDKGDNLQAFEFKFSTCDLNHFYVGTDTGYVIHGVRFGSSAFPRGHTSVIDTPVKVKTIDLSPFGYPYLLAGCSDGSVHLYHTKIENPLVSWNDLSEGQSSCIQSVRWSRSRAAVFFVLDDHSTLYTFDLLEGDFRPVHVDKVSTGKAVYMTLNNDGRILGSGQTKCPQLLLALDNGSTELHNIKQNLTEDKTLEGEFLKKFNERF